MYFWDYKSKKRLSYVRDLPTSVSSLAFNHDGSLIAIASSYLYENGKAESSNNPIFIRPIESSDLPPFSVCEQTTHTLFTKNGCFFSRHLSTHAWMPWMKSALVSSCGVFSLTVSVTKYNTSSNASFGTNRAKLCRHLPIRLPSDFVSFSSANSGRNRGSRCSLMHPSNSRKRTVIRSL